MRKVIASRPKLSCNSQSEKNTKWLWCERQVGERDIDHFEFVSEFKLSEKLDTTGTTYGLGVPLIAVRRKRDSDDPREKYYPEGLSFPVTALLRVCVIIRRSSAQQPPSVRAGTT